MIWLILLFGLILRLIALNQSFWLDEATTANVAAMSAREILTSFSPGDFHPPLYYLVAHFWSNLFGISEVSLRTISVLAGLGTIYTLYLIAKELTERKTGMIAALLLSTSGLHIYYSQEARMYSLATLFVSLTILFFVKTIKRGRVGEWILFSTFLALSAFTDYLPVLIIPALWAYAWIKKLKPLWWKKFFASHIILMGIGLIWFPTFVQQLSAGLSVRSLSPAWWQILGPASFKQLILIPTKFIFGRINMEVNPLQIVMVAAAFLMFGYLFFRSMNNQSRGRAFWLIWFWLGVPLTLGALISFLIPTLSYFRYLFILPAFYFLVTAGLLQFQKRIYTTAIVFLIFFNLVTSSYYLLYPQSYREDWRGLVSFISINSLNKNAAVVFVADSQKEGYRYYDKRYDKNAKILTRESLDGSFDEVWLMRYVQEVFDPEDTTRAKIEMLGYKKIEERDFNGVVVWRYQK